jgi:hypothetical protein
METVIARTHKSIYHTLVVNYVYFLTVSHIYNISSVFCTKKLTFRVLTMLYLYVLDGDHFDRRYMFLMIYQTYDIIGLINSYTLKSFYW